MTRPLGPWRPLLKCLHPTTLCIVLLKQAETKQRAEWERSIDEDLKQFSMSVGSDKPPKPPTVIRPLSIFTLCSLWTSHLCSKDLFFFPSIFSLFCAAAACIESLFFAMCGYSGHFEEVRLGVIRECAPDTMEEFSSCYFVSRPKPTPWFLIIHPFLISIKQRK